METRQTADSAQQTPFKRGQWVGAVIALAVIVAVLWITGAGRYLMQRAEYAGRAPTFTGSSERLTRTVIVPTLDTPCPPGKNVIWCSSFQLAWNELRDNVIGAPLQVIGAEETAGRLNADQQSGADLDPKSFYAAGGRVQQGIRERVRQDMASRFPSHTLPDFNDYDSGILSYAYLHANVPFKYPFRQMGIVCGGLPIIMGRDWFMGRARSW